MLNTNKKIPFAFIRLAIAYLLFGLLLGVIGSFQYLLPDFLKEKLGFQHVRPLHVYLVIAWIFSAAHGAMYYYVQKVTDSSLKYPALAKFHLYLQLIISLLVIGNFFAGNFSGREYLEFPVWIGALIIVSWIAFAVNIFSTLKPNYKNAPVYYFSWTVGIAFFFITFGEAYLWQLPFFNDNPIRDTTVQWKAMGSMVGAWNMLIYGSAMCSMEQMKKGSRMNYEPLAFFFFFVGFTNLLFNWGHHTYIVPAKPWVRQVAFIISMTELILLFNIIRKWRKSMQNNYSLQHKNTGLVLVFADNWTLINLVLAIAISVPALNYYTHGTHITVAHAMGATIGINTLLLFSIIYHIVDENKTIIHKWKKLATIGSWTTNLSLVVFFFALVGAGIVKAVSMQNNMVFAEMMLKSKAYFILLAASGTTLMIGLLLMSIAALNKMKSARKMVLKPVLSEEFMNAKTMETTEV